MNFVAGGTSTRGVRVEVDPLVYVNFPEQSQFILNLSERGMAIQAMDVLEPGQLFNFSFPLPETEHQLQGVGRIAWSDRSGRAGMEFTRLSEPDRIKLAQWLQQRPWQN